MVAGFGNNFKVRLPVGKNLVHSKLTLRIAKLKTVLYSYTSKGKAWKEDSSVPCAISSSALACSISSIDLPTILVERPSSLAVITLSPLRLLVALKFTT